MSLINVKDLRLSSDYVLAERFNSTFALSWLITIIAFPLVMCFLYWRNIKRIKPYPNLRNDWNEAKLKKVYKTTDLEEIEKKYTVKKYEKMLAKYGGLIEDLDLKRLGKFLTMLTICVRIYHKLLFSLSIMLFLDYPVLTVILFTYNGIFYLMFINWFQPFKEAAGFRQVMFDEVVNMIVVYHLYCLTEYTDSDQKELSGKSIIYFMGIQTAAFIIYVLSMSIA
jgi:hypothetical protein